MRTLSRVSTAVSATTILALVAACAGNGSDDDGGDNGDGDWPTGTVEFVIPTAAGGGLDTTFRQIQPYLEEELGQPIAVEYREGGQFSIGTAYVAENGGDCEPFMFHAIPDVIFSYLTQDVPYTYEDFYPLAGMTTEPSTVWVHDDAPWATLEEFLDEARANPGEVRVSVANLTNADHLAVLNLQEEADVEFNIISYDGGGPARNAVVAGEVEAGMGGVFAGQGIAEDARALTVFNDTNEWPELTDDAPAVNDVLGSDIDPIGGSYTLLADRDCYDEYPDRFQTLADSIAAAMENDDFISDLEELGEEAKLAYQGPDEYHEFVQGEIDTIETLLEESPELFGLD